MPETGVNRGRRGTGETRSLRKKGDGRVGAAAEAAAAAPSDSPESPGDATLAFPSLHPAPTLMIHPPAAAAAAAAALPL